LEAAEAAVAVEMLVLLALVVLAEILHLDRLF